VRQLDIGGQVVDVDSDEWGRLRFGSASLQRLVVSRPYPARDIDVALQDSSSHAVLHYRALESAHEETSFLLGSFTKVLTATIICQLVDEGRIRLDDSASNFLTDFGFKDITIRQLLSHTAGLADMFHLEKSADDVIAYITRVARIAEAGAAFSYSNAGYVVLGRIIEQICGTPWFSEVERRLLIPLDAQSVKLQDERSADSKPTFVYSRQDSSLVPGLFWPEVGPALDAAGGRLVGTARDAARLARAIITGVHPTSEARILSRSILREMLKPHVVVPGAGLMASRWCLGWSLLTNLESSTAVYGHQGGTSVLVGAVPKEGSAIAVLTNFSFGTRIAREIISAITSTALPQPPPIRLIPDASCLIGLEGTYSSETLSVTVYRDGDQLRITNPLGGAAVDLTWMQGRTFSADLGELVSDVTFSVQRENRASAVHVALRQLQKVGD